MNDNDLQEAQQILRGETMMRPTIEHLRALQNQYDDFRAMTAVACSKMLEESRK